MVCPHRENWGNTQANKKSLHRIRRSISLLQSDFPSKQNDGQFFSQDQVDIWK